MLFVAVGLALTLNLGYAWDRYLRWRESAPRWLLLLTDMRLDEITVPRWIGAPLVLLFGAMTVAIAVIAALSVG